MTAYLAKHKPKRPQFRRKRRAEVTGCIVLHTAENATDMKGADKGAENVANFIANRTDAAGSYHDLVDSDSWVQICEYHWEAFHCSKLGANRWGLSLSWAIASRDWPKLMRTAQGPKLVDIGAKRAANQAEWVKAQTGIVVPAKRITRAQAQAGRPGFVTHGEMDPSRRTDPGKHFPWGEFLERFAAYSGGKLDTGEDDYMAFTVDNGDEAEAVQRLLAFLKFDPGPIDGKWGPRSNAALDGLRKALGGSVKPAPPAGGDIENELADDLEAFLGGLLGANLWKAKGLLDRLEAAEAAPKV